MANQQYHPQPTYIALTGDVRTTRVTIGRLSQRRKETNIKIVGKEKGEEYIT
jgi:hypothetical protein